MPAYVAKTTAVPDLRAEPRHVEVHVTRDHLDVSIDGHRVLATDVALPARAFVGFTAANGGYTDEHVVTNIRADAASGIGSVGGGPVPDTIPTTTTATTTPPVEPQTPTSGAPPAAGYFTMSAPGSPLPSGAECAARVHRSSWEPRPENTTANHTTPPAAFALGSFSQWSSAWNATYRTRIDGGFTGTTDEIAQWAACKWGWSDNLVRAQMMQESTWRQSTESDRESRAGGHCVYDDTPRSLPHVVLDHPGEVVLPPGGRLVVVAAVELSVDQAEHRLRPRPATRRDARLLRRHEHVPRQHARRRARLPPVVVLRIMDAGRRVVRRERRLVRERETVARVEGLTRSPPVHPRRASERSASTLT